MVILLRAAGIEARNVNGFLGGEWSQFGNYLAVTQNQAHSWVEVWFPDFGWVTFDPTPGGVGSTVGLESWFWPGRIFFDGIQHRWNKWVLDYSIESQSGIFQRWSGAFARRNGSEGGPRIGPSGSPPIWGAALLALVVLTGMLWARRGTTVLARETRMYLQLRDACQRAGLRITPGVTPNALLKRIRERGLGAGPPAERVVDLYVRARYGREALGPTELEEMKLALVTARRHLSTHGA